MLLKVILLLTLLVSCTPTPVDEQLTVEDGTNAKLVLTSTTSANLGVMAVGSTTPLLVKVTNFGALDATNLNVQIVGNSNMSFTGDAYPGINGTCTDTILSGDVCFIEVFVFSNFAASLNEKLVLNFKDGIDTTSESYPVSGFFGNPGALLPSVSSVNFGNIQVGIEATQMLTVTNSGQLGVEEMSAFVITTAGDAGNFDFTGGAYPGINGTCGTALAPGESCSVEVKTVPSYLEFEHNGSIEFSYKNPSQYQGISISLNTYGADIKGYITAEVKDNGPALYSTAVNNAADASMPIITYVLTNSGYLDSTAINFKSSGELPLVVSENRCPANLAPLESCEIDLMMKPQYAYPLPIDFEFPLLLSDQPIVFEYDNSKDVGLQESNVILGTGSVIGEANLLVYPNSNTSEPLNTDIIPLIKTDVWSIDDWNVIVGTGGESRKISFKNGALGKNTSMSNVTFSITPSDGAMKVSCIVSNNCKTFFNDGQTVELTLVYDPTIAEDRTNDPYVLTVNYFDGVKDKTFNIEIPTVASSFPYISIDESYLNEVSEEYEVNSKTMLNKPVIGSIVIRNEGVSGVNIKNLINRPSGQVGEENYTFDDTDCDREIKDSETCTLSFSFSKGGDARAKPFVAEQFLNYFTFTNGIADGEFGYQIFRVNYNVRIFERGWYDIPEQNIEFGDVLLSTNDVDPTVGETNIYNQYFLINVADIKGNYSISNFKFEFSGEEATHFSVSPVVSGTGATSVIRVGGVDPAGISDEGVSATVMRGIIIRYTAPNQGVDLGSDGMSTAQLNISYHGQGQADTGTDYEPEVITLNLSAKPVVAPKYVRTTILERDPFMPQLYDPDEPVQLFADVKNASHTIVTVTNKGLSDNMAGAIANLKTWNNNTEVKETNFKIRAVDANDPCFTSINTLSYQEIEFSIAPMESCDFEIYDYQPDSFGELSEQLKLSYTNPQAVVSSIENFKATAFQLADLAFSPSKGTTINFVKFNDIDLATSTSKDFNIVSSITSRYVVPGEVVSINRVDDRTGIPECNVALNLPPSWEGYATIYKPTSFTLDSNSCNGERIHPGEPTDEGPTYFTNYVNNCPLQISFTPQHIGKAEVTCFAVSFKENESASSSIVTNYVLMAGAGKVPKTNFKGWTDILAEGETLDSPAKIKIAWKDMKVVDDLGEVVGYAIYRKTLQDGIFPDEYIYYTNMIEDLYNYELGQVEFTDSMDEVLPPESTITPLAVNKIYSYKIKALIEVPGEGTFLSETQSVVGENDHVADVILPAPYHSLVHRWSANIHACMDQLGKAYSDLSREKDYSCDYTGELNKNGKFDVVEHTLVERYETGKRLSDGKPDFTPNLAPYLFDSLSQAKDYCASNDYTISDLNIFNESKELIKRIDYRIASIGVDPTTCVDTGNPLVSGGNRCKSIFGIQDLVGNAWDMIDDSLTPQDSTTWVYDTGSQYQGQEFYLPVSALDLDTYVGTNYNTWMDFFKFDSNVQCFNTLFNEPRFSLGGICADAKGEILMDDAYASIINEVDSTDTTVIFPKYESELGSAFTIKRFLMMGGSTTSASRFDVKPSSRVMYWTNPQSESILMAQHPNGQYESGAPRCVFRFSLE